MIEYLIVMKLDGVIRSVRPRQRQSAQDLSTAICIINDMIADERQEEINDNVLNTFESS